METGIRIGHENTAETVREVTSGIVTILDATVVRDREVTLAALSAFQRATSIDHVTLTGCRVDGGGNTYALELEPEDD